MVSFSPFNRSEQHSELAQEATPLKVRIENVLIESTTAHGIVLQDAVTN
jgi:hypothetical protein